MAIDLDRSRNRIIESLYQLYASTFAAAVINYLSHAPIRACNDLTRMGQPKPQTVQA